MQKEIELEIIGHLNQLKLNKQNVKIIKDEIRSESMKLFHFLMKQQIKLIKQTDKIEKELELNLNDLINKKNNLLNKSEFNFSDYNEIINNNNLQTNFNYQFKTNEIIGHLLVIIFNNYYFYFLNYFIFKNRI